MILYSIVPVEVVFRGAPGQEAAVYFEAGYRGERVVVAKAPDGRCSVARLLSTSPQMFLKPDFQPGSEIDPRELDKNIKRKAAAGQPLPLSSSVQFEPGDVLLEVGDRLFERLRLGASSSMLASCSCVER